MAEKTIVVAKTEEHGDEELSRLVGESLRESPIDSVFNLRSNPLASLLGIRSLAELNIKGMSLTELRELWDLGLPKDCDEGANLALCHKTWYDLDDYSSNVYEKRQAAHNSAVIRERNPLVVINFHEAPLPGNDALYVSGTKSSPRTQYDSIALASTLMMGRVIYVPPEEWPGCAITHYNKEVAVEMSNPPEHPNYHGPRGVVGAIRTLLQEMVVDREAIIRNHCRAKNEEYTLIRTLRDGDPELDDLNDHYDGISAVNIYISPDRILPSTGEYAVANFSTQYRPVRGELLHIERSRLLPC